MNKVQVVRRLHAQRDELLAVIAAMHERICTDGLRIATLARGWDWLVNVERERDEARELLRCAWMQFSIVGKDGKRWAGGLAVLEDIEAHLAGEDS